MKANYQTTLTIDTQSPTDARFVATRLSQYADHADKATGDLHLLIQPGAGTGKMESRSRIEGPFILGVNEATTSHTVTPTPTSHYVVFAGYTAGEPEDIFAKVDPKDDTNFEISVTEAGALPDGKTLDKFEQQLRVELAGK